MKKIVKSLIVSSLFCFSLNSQARIEKNDPRPPRFNQQQFLADCKHYQNMGISYLRDYMLNPNNPKFVDRTGVVFYYWSVRTRTVEELENVIRNFPCGYTAQNILDNVDALVDEINHQVNIVRTYSHKKQDNQPYWSKPF